LPRSGDQVEGEQNRIEANPGLKDQRALPPATFLVVFARALVKTALGIAFHDCGGPPPSDYCRAFSEGTHVSACTRVAVLFNFQWLGSMRLELAILSIAGIVCACRTHKVADRIPPDALSVVLTDCRREHDTGFSAHEKTLVGTARRYLEQIEHRRIDAYFRVRRTFDGNEVIVMAVSGYDGCSQPIFDKYCTVVLSDDGSILRIFPLRGRWSLIGLEPMTH